MAKKIKEKINITKDFVDGCLFGSWRYYIGRHSIHAHSHATDVIQFFKDNPNLFSKERMEFMGSDIIKCINDQLNWYSNIHLESIVYDTDMLIALCNGVQQYITKNNISDITTIKFEDLRFDVFENGSCKITPRTDVDHLSSLKSLTFSDFQTIISDLMVWSQTAQTLKPNLKITYEYDGERNEVLAIESFDICRYQGEDHFRFVHKYSQLDDYIKNPYYNRYINPEYIKEVNIL